MPRRRTSTKAGTAQVLRNSSFESLVVSWLMQDGWQVFIPIVDHAHRTDILISDGPNYYRVQVKTIDAASESHVIENRWADSEIECVICFARNSNWGYVMPAFSQKRKKLNAEGHFRFQQNKTQFLKAFHAF